MKDMLCFFKELEETIRCPVCLCTLSPPLSICELGHLICNTCKKDRSECPTCRACFDDKMQIPTLINAVLNSFPRECKFGCTKTLLPRDLHHHLKTCSYRDVSCRKLGCNWVGKSCSLLQHFKTDHPLVIMFNKERNIAAKNVTPYKDRYFVTPVQGYGCIFWEYMKINARTGKCMVFFVCVPTSDNITDDFYSVVSFSNKNTIVKFKYTQKIFEESVDTEDIFSCEDCMKVPLSALSNFINSERTLVYSFKIVRG